MAKKFQINLSNKLFYILVVIGIVVLGGIGVYAYGGSSPSVMGHSAGELDGVCLSDGTNCNFVTEGGGIGNGPFKVYKLPKRSSNGHYLSAKNLNTAIVCLKMFNTPAGQICYNSPYVGDEASTLHAAVNQFCKEEGFTYGDWMSVVNNFGVVQADYYTTSWNTYNDGKYVYTLTCYE